MAQAAVLDGLLFGALPLSQDCFTAAEVEVSRGEVADALLAAVVVVLVGDDSELPPQVRP